MTTRFPIVAALALVAAALALGTMGHADAASPVHATVTTFSPDAVNPTTAPPAFVLTVNNTAATTAGPVASIWRVEIDVPVAYAVGAPTAPTGWTYDASNSGPRESDGVMIIIFATTTTHDATKAIAPHAERAFTIPLTSVAPAARADGTTASWVVKSWDLNPSTDENGVTGGEYDEAATTVTDTTPPVITAIASSVRVAKVGALSLTFDASEALVQNPVVKVNGVSATFSQLAAKHYTYTYTVATGNAQGPATITVHALDHASNVGDAAAAADVLTIDTVAPTLTLTQSCAAAGSAGWCRGSVTAGAAVTDATSAATVTCELDGVAQTGCAGIASAADGSHRFFANATDAAGNTATVDHRYFTIDATPPTLVLRNRTAANAAGWNAGNVALTWNCTDATSNTTTPWLFANATGEGDALSQSATCLDVAGNSATNTVTAIKIDRTAPTLGPAALSPAPNADGWSSTDVTITWTCTDALSGPLPNVTRTVTGEGSALTATGDCADLAGNVASAPATTVRIDRTAPTIAFTSRTPAANALGWSKADVTLAWSCSDALSGPIAPTLTKTIAVEGSSLSATATCVDSAGNTASDTRSNVKIDKTGPVIIYTPTCATPGTSGWCRSNAHVVATAADALSGLVTLTCTRDAASVPCTGFDITTAGHHVVAITATDLAGVVTTGGGAVDIDVTAPTLAPTLTPASSDGLDGWYRHAPTLTWTTSDATSGAGTVLQCIDATAGCTPTLAAPAGALPDGDDHVEARVTDAAGNSASASIRARVDTTPPDLAIVLTPAAPTGLGGYYTRAVSAAFTASDATSRIADVAWSRDGGATFTSGTRIASLPEGTTTLTVRASDAAGNVRTVTATIRVDRTAPTVAFPATALAAGATHLDLAFSEPMDTLGAPLLPVGWTGAWSADARTFAVRMPELPYNGAWTIGVPGDLMDAHGLVIGRDLTQTFVTGAPPPDAHPAPTSPTSPVASVVPPDAPADVHATLSGTTATLAWTAPANAAGHGAVRYVVLRDGAILATVSAPTYVDSALAIGRTYTYVVLAQNDLGRGAASVPAAIAIPAAADARATTTPAAPDGANGWFVTPPSVAIAPTRAGAGVSATLDGGLAVADGAIGALPDGTHTVRYHATEPGVGDGPARELTLRVDSSKPVLVSLDVRSAHALVARARDAGSGVASVTLTVRDATGGVLATARADGAGPSFELPLAQTLLAGDYAATLVVTDVAGNALMVERTFTITPEMLPTLLKGELEHTSVTPTAPTEVVSSTTPEKPTPGAPLAIALAAMGAVAIAMRRRRA